MSEIRKLGPGDEEALEAFLQGHADSSMFLRSNLRLAGIEYRGERFQGDWFGAFRGGRLTAAAGLFWNGNLILQAPDGLEAFLNGFVPGLTRPVEWLSGPWEQVARARDHLGLSGSPATYEGRDGLYALALDRLVVPEPLESGTVRCRLARPEDLGLLVPWRVAYLVELIGTPDDETLRRETGKNLRSDMDDGVLWVLEEGEKVVSMTGFNAHLPDRVQIGGVWTPPDLRCRGHARCAVAGSLLQAREEGVEGAILFTESGLARKVYEAIGFREIGEYGLIRFERPQDLGDGPL